MGKKHYNIVADLDYIQGHLRRGHLEGQVDLTDEELAQLKKDPDFAKKLDLDVRVDSLCVDDVGSVDALTVVEVDESGTTLREVDLLKD